MGERNTNPQFLHRKFRDLNTSPEVEAIVAREVATVEEPTAKQTRTKDLIPQKPETRIQTYLNYLKECISIEDPRKRAEKLARIKQVLREKYVIKPKDVPESYWTSIRRRHREEGHGEIEIPEEQKTELASDIATEQINSLDGWIDYLASPDAEYPDWFKYYAIRSVLRLNKFDKEKKQFTERTKGTVSPFPDLNRDALALVCDALVKRQAGTELDLGYDITAEDKQQFQQYLQQENFAKMYAWAMEHFNPIPEELLKKTTGEWRAYPKGSDPTQLTRGISAYSTGWCIRGEATAARYLTHSDLEVYFSEDQDGNPNIPRIVVVRRDNQTQEVRGVAHQENLDPYISGVVEQKLTELPDGKVFEKKNQDMKQLTAIENKIQKGQELNRADLVFLYEIDSAIQGFGYQKDPRIAELRSQRDPKADAPLVFDCEANQIAWGQNEITENTKAYIGPLFPNIFQILKHLEYLYTAFPEGRIVRNTIDIGGQTKEELQAEMKRQNIQIYGYAQSMLDSKDFTTAKKSEPADLVRLKVRDFNLPNPTMENIYRKAEELGLELCPAEVGPQYRLQYTDQPSDEYLYIAMKQIADSDGSPGVFGLGRVTDGLWLSRSWAWPADGWYPAYEFVFRSRPSTKA